MRLYELLEMVAELLKRMSELDIRIDDYKHVAMCREYNELMAKGEKKEYAREMLAKKYKLSQSTVFRIVNRLSKRVKM